DRLRARGPQVRRAGQLRHAPAGRAGGPARRRPGEGAAAVNPLDLSLYLVTDTRLCGDRGVRETVRRAVRGGVTAVQLRDHDATTRELCTLGEALRQELAGTGVPLLIDDRLDVALAVHAEGVHLGQ